MRTVALDVHKRFAEVAVHEQGEVRRLGRIETSELRAFAESLRPDDHVVLESTAMTWAIAELLARHAGRVTVSNPMRTKAIASAKVKTDKVDAKVLAQLGAADFLPEVWAPDAETRALRRRVAHRASLVRQRTRVRNQVHAVLLRNLLEAPVTDLFGLGGRRWLAEIELPEHEREQVESELRLHDALDSEVKLVDRQLAKRALADADVRRLMTIPASRATAVPGPVTSPARVRRTPEGCSSRRPTRRPARQARCAPSTPVSSRAAARRSRPARPPASSPSSAGTCSPRTRTTATTPRRSCRPSSGGSNSRPARTAPTSASPAPRDAASSNGNYSKKPNGTTAPRSPNEQETARVPPLGRRLLLALEGQTMRDRPNSPHGLLFSTGSPAPRRILSRNLDFFIRIPEHSGRLPLLRLVSRY